MSLTVPMQLSHLGLSTHTVTPGRSKLEPSRRIIFSLDYFLSLRNVYGSSYAAHDAYLGNLCGALESINNGTTYIVNHSHIPNSPEHSDAVVKGLIDAKIRGVFCYTLYKNPWWEGSTLDKRREEETPNWRIDDAWRIRQEFFQSNKPENLLRFGFVPGEPDPTPFDEICDCEMGAALTTLHPIAQGSRLVSR
ncbi:hypothetical protein MMC13_000199 [Lambiella insularis]|nr:hypothetical protein [Lambiella insularis]